VALGRYDERTTGPAVVKLSGQTSEGSQSFDVETVFPAEARSREYIPALWAARKVGWLLDQIRLHGENKELVDEIVRLGTEYGILTEYTAFLAQEQGTITAAEATDRLAAPTGGFGAGGALQTTTQGGYAISQRDNTLAMQKADNMAAQNAYIDAEGNWQRIGNIINVGQRGFIQQGEQWVDSRLRVGTEEQLKPELQVQAFSEAHFQLARDFPKTADMLSAAQDLLVLINGHVVQIGEQGKQTLTDDDLKLLQTPVQPGNAPGDDVGALPAGEGNAAGVSVAGLAMAMVLGLAVAFGRHGAAG